MEKYFYTENLAIGYDKKTLIDNINIGIHKGNILTLIGPNGSGKSTFIKSIIKELSLVSGVVCIDGKQINNYSNKEYAKKMAVILTERIKTEMMTAFDVVALGRYPYTDYFGRLTKEDKEEFARFGESLGYLDVEMQKNAMKLYLKELEQKIEYLQKEIPQKRKLYQSLGVMGGIFLLILLWQ